MDKELKARIQENKVLTSQERKNIIRDLRKLDKIEQIVNDKHYSVKALEYEIREILEQE